MTKQNSDTNQAIKAKIDEQINAEPDGTFHWTKKYEKILADLEATKPLEPKEYTLSESWLDKKIEPYISNGKDIEAYIQDVVAGKQVFNQKTLEALLEVTYARSLQSDVYYGILSYLSEVMTYTELLDVMVMGIWHKFHIATSQGSNGYFHTRFPLNEMYILLQNQQNPSEIVDHAKTLIKKYPIPLVRLSMFFLFPDDIDVVEGEQRYIDRMFDFSKHFTRFFNHPEMFGFAYASDYGPSRYYGSVWSAKFFLLTIKNRQDDVIRMADAYLKDCWRYLCPTQKVSLIVQKHLPKVRQLLKLLDNYHHVNVLDFLLTYSHEPEVINAIGKWIERYPVFTLNHLMSALSDLTPVQIKNIKALIKTQLTKDPTLIKPLKHRLKSNKKHFEINRPEFTLSITLVQMLDNLCDGITSEHIKQALNEKITHFKETNTQGKKTKKITQKRLVYPILPLTRITTTLKIADDFDDGLDASESYNKDGFNEVINHPETHLYPIFEMINEPSELIILKENYDDFSDEQKWLANIFMKPSILVSEKFKQANAGNYFFKDSDYLMRPEENHWYSTKPKKIHYSSIREITLKNLNLCLRSAIFMGELPLKKLYSCSRFDNDLLAFFKSRPDDEVIDVIVSKYIPICSSKLWFVSQIIHHTSVPYLIDAFTKRKKHYMERYLKKSPETVINETIYLIFTKQTDAQLKKTKKSAKVLFERLVEKQREHLVQALTAYDKQLMDDGEPATLMDFLVTYETLKFSKQPEAKKIIPQATNAEGIPESLLNDDWQKATRKRNIELSSTINYYDFPVLVVEQSKKPLPKQAQTRLLTILMLSDFKKPMPMLLSTLQHMSKQSQTELADALWDEYLRLNMSNTEKWLMMASGFLYHEGLDEKIWEFTKKWQSTKRGSIKISFAVLAQQAISHPNTKAQTNALRMLIRLSQKTRTSLRPTAEEQLERYARLTNQSKEDVSDSIIPTLGLDKQGKRVFDFGERQFIMTLDALLKPKFVDNKGKAFKNMPKAGKTDNANKVRQAHTELKEIKKQIKVFLRDDVPRMENMLINQRRMSFANFKQFYINNSLMLRYSFQLVWGIYDKNHTDQLVQPFRVVETGEIFNLNDNLTIEDDALIGLVHPIQLTESQKTQLGQSLHDDEVIQPFPQLARPVYQLSDDEKKQNIITRFADETFTTGSLMRLKNDG